MTPRTADELTDGWLTELLRSRGILHTAAVVHHEAEPLTRQGAIGSLVRVRLDYDKPEEAAPASLVAKSAATNDAMRRLGNATGVYQREARFYTEIAETAGISVPRCFFAAHDRDTGHCLLLLEDLRPSRTGNAAASSPDDISRAVDALAGFHAKWWDSQRLAQLRWLFPVDHAPLVKSWQESLARAIPKVRERFPHEFSGPLVEAAERLATNYGPVAAMLARSPQVLVHGDFHTQNMHFPTPAGGRFAVIDWQLVERAPAAVDLACLLSFSLQPGERRRVEARLVEHYHGLLTSAGVTGYDLDACWRDYRLGIVRRVQLHVTGIQAWDERAAAQYESEGIRFTDVMLTRLNAFLEDHDVLSMLPRPAGEGR